MPTAIGKITDIEGNKFVLNGKDFYYTKKGLVMTGANIGVDVTFNFEIPPGKRYKVIESWGVATPEQVKSSPPATTSSSSWKQPDTGIEGLTEPQLRFISNVVGQAIMSNQCKCSEVHLWTKSAYDALHSLEAGI